jgi:predicted DNA-binding WGR domain protein
MEPEVTAKRPRKSSPKPPLTIEAAKEKILAKLQTAGAKGATSLYTKTQAKDAAAFEAALAELTDEQRPEVFVDRRAAKPKYFLWALRPRVLSIAEAKAELRRTFEQTGAKGATSLYSKTQAKDAAAFEAALAELTDEQRPEVFVDRRAAKPRYLLWALRPKQPTAEGVGEKLLAFLRAEHPRIHSETTLKKTTVKKKLGLPKDEAPLLAAALRALCEAGGVTTLEYPAAKLVTLYLAASAATPAPSAAPAFSPERVRDAYQALMRQSGFPAISISKLGAAAAADLQALKEYLLVEYRAGRVVLSLGDWSIASEEDRRGVIELHGQRYLQVRWL